MESVIFSMKNLKITFQMMHRNDGVATPQQIAEISRHQSQFEWKQKNVTEHHGIHLEYVVAFEMFQIVRIGIHLVISCAIDVARHV